MKPSQIDQAARDTVRLMMNGDSLTDALHLSCGPYPSQKSKDAVKQYLIASRWIDIHFKLTQKGRDEVG